MRSLSQVIEQFIQLAGPSAHKMFGTPRTPNASIRPAPNFNMPASPPAALPPMRKTNSGIQLQASAIPCCICILYRNFCFTICPRGVRQCFHGFSTFHGESVVRMYLSKRAMIMTICNFFYFTTKLDVKIC